MYKERLSWKPGSTISQEERVVEAERIYQSFTELYDYYTHFIHPTRNEVYKAKRLYTGGRQKALKAANLEDKSNIMRPLLASIHDTYFSNTYDTKTSIKAIPNGSKDKDYMVAKTAQDYINRSMQTSKADSTIKVMDEEAILIGVSYGRVGFDTAPRKNYYKKDGQLLQKEIKRACPTISYVDPYSLMFDPNSTDFYTAPKFYRQIVPVREVLSRYSGLIDIDVEKIKELLDEPAYFATSDPSKIRLLKQYSNLKQMLETCGSESREAIKNRIIDLENMDLFAVNFDSAKVEVVEYFEGDKFALFLNGSMVYFDVSPYPIDGDPFIRMAFRDEPGTLFPSGLGQKLLPVQKTLDAFLNNWIDVVNKTANPPYIADKGVFGVDTPEILKIKTNKVYERIANKTIDILRTVDPNAAGTLLSGINRATSQGYEIAGLNSYTQGGSGKVERTAGGVTGRVQVLKTALIPFLNSKNTMLAEMATRRQVMGSVYLDKQFTATLLGDDGSYIFSDIKISDLSAMVLFVYDNQSLKSLAKDEERQDLITAIQYVKGEANAKVLENRLLDSFNLKPFSLEEKKEMIKQDFELQTYATSLQQPQNNLQNSQVENSMPTVMNADIQKQGLEAQTTTQQPTTPNFEELLRRPQIGK